MYVDGKNVFTNFVMLDYIWAFMIIIGIIYGAFFGQMAEISAGVIDSAREAVELCITMLGIVGFWTGLMEVARQSGLVEKLTKLLHPILKFLFPRIPREHKAYQYIALNFIANILGLGWAATPAGLKAMEEMATLQPKGKEAIASNEMCIFLIMNISSLQLIPVNMIAYRSQYGSVNPTVIIVPAIIATFISTLTAIIFCKTMDMGSGQ